MYYTPSFFFRQYLQHKKCIWLFYFLLARLCYFYILRYVILLSMRTWYPLFYIYAKIKGLPFGKPFHKTQFYSVFSLLNQTVM